MIFRCLASSAAALALAATPVLAQTPGAATIVNRQGNHVDGNTFPRKEGVYLTGAPAGACGTPGLPDGEYFFQVTDPSGSMLFTIDPLSERHVRVQGGVITQYLGTTRPFAAIGPCGALIVRLAPFVTSPNPVNEYRVWLTRVEDYDPSGSGLFGFAPGQCKSDVFRLGTSAPQSILQGHKFYDFDGDGAWNPGTEPQEVPVGGWRVELSRDGSLAGFTYTDQDGKYAFIRDRDATVWGFGEVSPNGFVNDATPGATWLATTARTGTAVASTEYVAAPEFGNVRFEVSVGSGRTWQYWSDQRCDDATAPGGICGRTVLAGCDPDWRVALNMRNGAPVNLRNPVSNDNPSASIFTLNMPPQSFDGAFANWKAFARKNPHDHAGFLLSREVGATILSNTCGFMQGTIYVDRFQDGVLVSLDDMLAGAIGLLSEVGAGLTGPNDPYQDLRNRMLNCINEFRNINESGDPAAPQVVFTRSSEPGGTGAPY